MSTNARPRAGHWALLMVLLFSWGMIPAATAAPSEIVLSPEVRQLVTKSSTQFQQGDYEGALASLLAAYERQPLSLFLFNIAQSHRKLGHIAEALSYYERFVKSAPSSPLVAESEAHAAALRAEMAARQAARDRADAETQAAAAQQRLREAEELAQKNEAVRKKVEEDLLLVERKTAQLEQKKPVYRRPVFWAVLGGVAAAGLVVGLGVGLGTRPPPAPQTDLPGQTVRF